MAQSVLRSPSSQGSRGQGAGVFHSLPISVQSWKFQSDELSFRLFLCFYSPAFRERGNEEDVRRIKRGFFFRGKGSCCSFFSGMLLASEQEMVWEIYRAGARSLARNV